MHQKNPNSHTASQNVDGRFILCTGLTLRLAGCRESGGSARRRKAGCAVVLLLDLRLDFRLDLTLRWLASQVSRQLKFCVDWSYSGVELLKHRDKLSSSPAKCPQLHAVKPKTNRVWIVFSLDANRLTPASVWLLCAGISLARSSKLREVCTTVRQKMTASNFVDTPVNVFFFKFWQSLGINLQNVQLNFA